MPLKDKKIFHKKFPNVDINQKDIDNYIKTKLKIHKSLEFYD